MPASLEPHLRLSARTPTCGCLAASKHSGWVPNNRKCPKCPKILVLLRPGPSSWHKCAVNAAIFYWSKSPRAQIQGVRPDCQRILESHLKLYAFTEIDLLVCSLCCSCVKIKMAWKCLFMDTWVCVYHGNWLLIERVPRPLKTPEWWGYKNQVPEGLVHFSSPLPTSGQGGGFGKVR